MEPWLSWIIIALALAALEIITGGTLVFLMLAAGATAAAVAAAVGADISWQLVLAAVVSIASLVVIRPIARRHVRVPVESRSGVAALVGQQAVVVETVTGQDGRIKLAGEVWSAHSFDGESEYDVGAHVQVLSIEGATALVVD